MLSLTERCKWHSVGLYSLQVVVSASFFWKGLRCGLITECVVKLYSVLICVCAGLPWLFQPPKLENDMHNNIDALFPNAS